MVCLVANAQRRCYCTHHRSCHHHRMQLLAEYAVDDRREAARCFEMPVTCDVQQCSLNRFSGGLLITAADSRSGLCKLLHKSQILSTVHTGVLILVRQRANAYEHIIKTQRIRIFSDIENWQKPLKLLLRLREKQRPQLTILHL